MDTHSHMVSVRKNKISAQGRQGMESSETVPQLHFCLPITDGSSCVSTRQFVTKVQKSRPDGELCAASKLQDVGNHMQPVLPTDLA